MVKINRLNNSIRIDKDGVVFIVPANQFRTSRDAKQKGYITFYAGFSPHHSFSEKMENTTVNDVQLTEENYDEQFDSLFFLSNPEEVIELTEIVGYDASKKQMLTHDMGFLNWIDYE